MKQTRFLLFALFLLFLISLVGCGGGKKSVSVTICASATPSSGCATTATVPTGHQQPFSANVLNATNSGVTWEVNGVVGGDTVNGTISSGGLYIAPQSVPTTPTVTVTAVSVEDTNKSADATVTITQGQNLVINPLAATLATGQQQQFTVTENGQPVSVTWSLSCQGHDCGTINTDGLYTAPQSPLPAGTNVIVTATSTTDTAESISATLTIT